MKALIAGIFTMFAFAANAGGFYPDCRRGVDHKHPSCYNNVQHHHNHHNHHNQYVHPRPVYPAYPNHYYRPHYYNPPVIVDRRGDWVAPLIGGIILGTVINEAAERNNGQTCEIREYVRNDGTVVRERTCYR